jgi:hypothetical protein
LRGSGMGFLLGREFAAGLAMLSHHRPAKNCNWMYRIIRVESPAPEILPALTLKMLH